jgi:hypothetical protein
VLSVYNGDKYLQMQMGKETIHFEAERRGKTTEINLHEVIAP